MKTMFKCLTALALTLLCAGCDKKQEDGPTGPAESIVLTRAESDVNTAVNGFGFDVFGKINETEGLKPMFISPLSLSLALAMTATGAEGVTEAQMLETMGFGGCSAADMGSYFQKMTSALLNMDPKTTLEIANAIWTDKNVKLKSEFVGGVKKWYNSEANTADMSSAKTIKEINSWVSKHTAGKIDKILDDNDTDLAMLLVNALYFKGVWAHEFESSSSGKFIGIDGKSSSVTMMKMKQMLKYSEAGDWRMVELPYGNGAFVMDILLPVDSFKASITGLGQVLWDKLMNMASTSEVELTMPSFKMEYEIRLDEVLKGLGMKDAFTFSADFSKMSDTPLYIDFVKQKSYVDVNMKGTEAAAVTAVGMKLESSGRPPKVIDFTVDRPFVFAIREASTGAIVFIGQKLN